jgi:hypothetical protein
VALVYDGSSHSETNFPIGHCVLTTDGQTTYNRNGSYTVRRVDGGNTFDYSVTHTGNTALSGTWRHRGRGTGGNGQMYQRVA